MLKKGLIKPNLGTMFIIHSDRTGATLRKIIINEIKKGERTYYSTDGTKEIVQFNKYIINDSPYEVDIEEGKTHSLDSGYGSGEGDLWGYSHFATLDEEVTNKLLEAETIRVKDKYLSGKPEDPLVLPYC